MSEIVIRGERPAGVIIDEARHAEYRTARAEARVAERVDQLLLIDAADRFTVSDRLAASHMVLSSTMSPLALAVRVWALMRSQPCLPHGWPYNRRGCCSASGPVNLSGR